MSGVWVAALDRVARMAESIGEPATATQARAIRARAVATIEAKLWMPSLKQYAFALLEDGTVNANVTAWAATAMAFGVLDREHGADMASRLASARLILCGIFFLSKTRSEGFSRLPSHHEQLARSSTLGEERE